MATRKFFQSLFLLLVLNALIKPLWIFGIDRKVQLITGTEVYGKYFALFGLTMVFNFIIDLGITIHYNRKGAASGNYLQQHFSASFFLKIVLSLLYAVLMIVISLVSRWEDWTLLSWLILNQVILSMLLFIRANITAMQHYRTDALFSVMDKFLVILFCGTLIYFPYLFGAITIHAFAFWQTASSLLTLLCAMIYVLLKGKISFRLPKKIFDVSYLRETIPYAMLVFLMSFHNRIDAYLLERLHHNGAYEAGIYAKAYRLMDVANMAGVLTAAFMLPYAARHLQDRKETRVFAQRILHLLMLAGVFIAAVAISLPGWIDTIVYHSNDNYSSLIISLCLPVIVAYYWIHVHGTIITAAGFIKEFILAAVFFVALNMVLNIIFIPQFGAGACTIIALLTQTLFAAALTAMLKKKIGFISGFPDTVKYVLLFLFAFGLLYLGKKLEWDTRVVIAVTLVMLILVANRMKIFVLKEVKQLLNIQ